MTNINNKLFAYIRQASNLSPEIVEQYKNSLIFMGDEKQIYQPLTNSYIGIGTTSYNNLLSYVEYVRNDVLQDLHHNIVEQNVVKSISAQWNPNELGQGQTVTNVINGNKVYGTADYSTTYLKAIGDVTLKGKNRFDSVNNFGNTTYSGINVSITHASGAKVVSGVDAYGFSYSAYVETTNSFITIDDTYTWTYIGEKATYLSDFAMQYAREQANKVYKNLLGENITYIEKEFNQVFTYNVETGEPNLDHNVYVYAYYNNGSILDFRKLEYGPDAVNGDITYIYYQYDANNIVKIAEYNSGTKSWELNTVAGVSCFDNNYEKSTEDGGLGTRIPVFYDFDESSVSYSNINIEDGINTIREVAYILDVITNGSMDGSGDTGIEMAYNIAQNHIDIENLKKWKDEIGDNSVTSLKAESASSHNEYISLSYYSLDHYTTDLDGKATGDVMINANVHIAPVLRKQSMEIPNYDDLGEIDSQNPTKTLTGVNYATYLPGDTGSYAGLSKEWKYDGNWSSETPAVISSYTGGWILLTSANKQTIIDTFEDPTNEGHYCSGDELKVFDSHRTNANFNSISDVITDIQQQGNKPTLKSLNDVSDNTWVYIPWSSTGGYKIAPTGVIKSLVDVEWVTSYIALTDYLIRDKISSSNGASLKSLIEKFKAREVSYNAAFIPGPTSSSVDEHGNITYNPTFYTYNTQQGDPFRGKYISYVAQVNAYVFAGTEELPADLILTHTNITSTDHTYTKIGVHEEALTDISRRGFINDNISDDIIALGDVPGTTTFLRHQTNTGFTVNTITAGQTVDLNNAYYYFDNSLSTYVPVNPLNIGITFAGHTTAISQLPSTGTYYYLVTPSHNTYYIGGHNYRNSDGANIFSISSYVTHLKSATSTNTGIADAWDVRSTIEEMFTWIDLDTMKPFVAS